jgi:tRNA (mo5U34)-methyltransferase
MLSGQFLSELDDILYEYNCGLLDQAQLIDRFSQIVADLPLEDQRSGAHILSEACSQDSLSSRCLQSSDLQRLSILLPWSTYTLSQNGSIGNLYAPSKRDKPGLLPDPLVSKLNDLIPFAGRRVIESGCFEGCHTISMAIHGAHVCAFDARIENVIKTLSRLWFYGLEDSATVDCLDLEIPDPYAKYAQTFAPDNSLYLFHCRGVLYHLTRPLDYLQAMTMLKPEFIYINTQVASPEQADKLFNHELGTFSVFHYREPGRSAPFAGTQSHALWLTEEGLRRVLDSLGYGQILFSRIRHEQNGLRSEILVAK